jgi:putative tryptophan/tyrosine transport system substrate-binding protein
MTSTDRVPPPSSERPRIGLLLAGDRSYPSYASFLEGLRALGYADGQTVEVEARFGEGRHERLPGLAAELAALRPDVLAVIGAVTFFAARAVAADIPLVFAIVLDPVEAGLVRDADRPGGTVTGATSYDPDQARRQVQLLKQAVPGLSRLAILGDAGVPKLLAEQSVAATEAAGLRPCVRLLVGPDDVAPAIAAFRREGAEALLVLEVPRTSTVASAIAGLAHEAGLPTMFGRDLARVGPMLAYGTSLAAAARCMAGLADRILKGAKPGDLPIERASEAELIVNIKVARDLGVEVLPEILAKAVEVVE